ncbi:MAG: sugar transferase, partial [Candidatus Liptonbacteria bacterium]|nr:sugar transferase [Candidatus Liptonbacteria bacterium]
MSIFKKILIFAGDLVLFYGALITALWLRYNTPLAKLLPGGRPEFLDSFYAHLRPFSFILFVWVLCFYLFDLYHPKTFRTYIVHLRSFLAAVFASFFTSMIIFYLFQTFFILTPKTNLAIFSLVFAVFDYGWRIGVAKILKTKEWQARALLIGDSSRIREANKFLSLNPQFGFSIIGAKNGIADFENAETLKNQIIQNDIDTLVIDEEILEKEKDVFLSILYALSEHPINIVKASDFYETIFQRVPLNELRDDWFVEHMGRSRKFYEAGKKLIDLILASALVVIISPVAALSALLIKLTSHGPAFYKQKRMGKNNKPFILYKFRSMKHGADGALWTEENDSRLTKFGQFLRFTHLDEVPQLINVLKGDITFIGPRPERVELAEQYGSLPYYKMRHITKPGITGWA